MSDEKRPELIALEQRLANTQDAIRHTAADKRHAKGYRTARENLVDLIDADSFNEYGQLAIAAQKNRRDTDELRTQTAADGVITGTATIDGIAVALAIYDYAVLAGTQGYFHHQKLDRIFELAEQQLLPVIIFTEGGGGRPGDTDVTTQIAGLNLTSFATWARLHGKVPRIAIANGYCFAGNAALFGCADITIATRTSWIGMGGPAMIEGGGLGTFAPTQIGPIDVQASNGVVDIVADDEAHATRIARQLISLIRHDDAQWDCVDQQRLRDAMPEDRRYGYKIRPVIETLADTGSFIELRRDYGRPIVTGLLRIEGTTVGVVANDCQQMGGAIDAESADKAAQFFELCDRLSIPILSLTDTPGFMVGPDSESDAAVRRMATLFTAGARLCVPVVAVILRRGYGLGAMAMAGGSFAAPRYTVAWPSGEFGGMGLEGAVRLGYRKELDACENEAARDALFETLVAKMYAIGKATEAAAHLEIDAVIDPIDTRAVIIRALR
ncbi:MAG: carboxyl transferase domain-containing protein [Pseudomonadota bacterium]